MPVNLRSRSLRIKNEPDEDLPLPIAKRRAQTKLNLPGDDEIKSEPTRNVEEIRRKNLEDNKAFLESLLLTKIRDDFKSSTNTLQLASKKETKKRDFKFITVSENIPVRRSRRIAQMDVDGNKRSSPTTSGNEIEVTDESVVVTAPRRQRIYKPVPDCTPKELEEIKKKIAIIFAHNDRAFDVKKSIDICSDMNITEENVLKLTPDRLISMDIHPRSDMLAIIGCDRNGIVGLVVKSSDDLHGTWSKINYDFHPEYATCCRFNRFQSDCIHSTSYDSTLRTCDITQNRSIEIFRDSNNHGLTSFDYVSFQSLLISEDNGDVLRIDIRANPVLIDRFDLSKKRLRTLHINPMQPEEFCLSGTDNCVKVYDLRNMSSMKYCLQTGYSCYGAYYNQVGSHIMTTTRDDHVMSFSCHDMQHASDPLAIQPLKRIHHRNYVNRFVTPFTAQPYGLFESYFLIGSYKQPRSIQILDENCQIMNSFSSENLNSLATVNVAHRTLPIVVGGNSSGRIHVFTGQI